MAGAAALALAATRGGAEPRPLFEEIPPEASGIRWVHDNAASVEHYLPETMGPGCAFLDYDNDGWMDIFLVNSGPCDFYKPAKPIRNALYKNNRDGTFTDVTEKAGVAGDTFGMGVAVGDYDNDGFPDIFVTAYGRPILYRNNGNGTFTDVSEKAGLGAKIFENHWTTSAVWFDFDNDGRLDLFVCSFVDYGTTSHFSCGDNKLGKHFYCIPRVFKGTSSLLFHNNGDGTFTEVGRGTDIEKALGKGLGVVATDINNDGRMDLFVANDTVQNFLFVNRGPDAKGKTKWEEIALAAEVGFSAGWPGALRHGRGRGRFRRRRLAGPVRRQRRSGNVLALQEHEERDLPRCRVQEPGGAGHAPAERLGPALLRLRQRRRARSVPGQRPPRRHDRQLLAAGEVQGAAAAVPQRKRPTAQRERGSRAGVCQDRFRRADWRSAITTTTAAWMC